MCIPSVSRSVLRSKRERGLPYLGIEPLARSPRRHSPAGPEFRLKLYAGPAIRINIVLNWFEELKERVPVP